MFFAFACKLIVIVKFQKEIGGSQKERPKKKKKRKANRENDSIIRFSNTFHKTWQISIGQRSSEKEIVTEKDVSKLSNKTKFLLKKIIIHNYLLTK